jgi:hypothetical protein
MRYNFALVIASTILLMLGCKKDSELRCDLPSLNVYAEGRTAEVTLNSSSAGFYEIEYGPSGFARGAGTKKNASGSTNIVNLPLGTYDIYARGNCGGNNFSNWVGPQSFLIDGSSSSCPTPTGVEIRVQSSDYYVSWLSTNDLYDVEIVETGFELGSGKKYRVNNNYIILSPSDFIQGKTYDLYVRGNCGASTFSSWSNPKSFIASLPGGTSCSKPTNVTAYKSGTRDITYEFNGNSASYQISFSTSSSGPGSILDTQFSAGTYTFSSTTGIRYFWARGRCGVGSFTEWVVVDIL